MHASLGGTNMTNAFSYVYSMLAVSEDTKIYLLTDGEDESKRNTLKLISNCKK